MLQNYIKDLESNTPAMTSIINIYLNLLISDVTKKLNIINFVKVKIIGRAVVVNCNRL